MKKRTTLRSTLHDTAAKLSAVKEIRRLMSKGHNKWDALTRVASNVSVTPQTASNWLNKYKDVTVTLPGPNSDITNTLRSNHSDGFAIQSVNLRTTDGVHIELTPVDINKIATLASTIC